jgi:hypothetical protein
LYASDGDVFVACSAGRYQVVPRQTDRSLCSLNTFYSGQMPQCARRVLTVLRQIVARLCAHATMVRLLRVSIACLAGMFDDTSIPTETCTA